MFGGWWGKTSLLMIYTNIAKKEEFFTYALNASRLIGAIPLQKVFIEYVFRHSCTNERNCRFVCLFCYVRLTLLILSNRSSVILAKCDHRPQLCLGQFKFQGCDSDGVSESMYKYVYNFSLQALLIKKRVIKYQHKTM